MLAGRSQLFARLTCIRPLCVHNWSSNLHAGASKRCRLHACHFTNPTCMVPIIAVHKNSLPQHMCVHTHTKRGQRLMPFVTATIPDREVRLTGRNREHASEGDEATRVRYCMWLEHERDSGMIILGLRVQVMHLQMTRRALHNLHIPHVMQREP